MPQEELGRLAARIGRLAEFLATTDAVRVRVEGAGEAIELSRGARRNNVTMTPIGSNGVVAEPPALRLDAITAELVGVFHLSRPAPAEGEVLEEDRELAYVEALGIRNPVHSLGAGRIVSIAAADGAAVEYGQPLFLLDRG